MSEMIKAKAILCVELNAVAVREIEVPRPAAGEILTETICTCVSPGTELRTMSGGHPQSDQRPFIPGYANVGRVVDRGPGVTMPLGTMVLCGGTTKASVPRLWGAHVSHALCLAHDAIPIPESLNDPVAASVARLLAIAYHGCRLSNPRIDEKVAVVGLGPIGMMSALVHTLSGARVVGFDLYEERVALARSLGLEVIRVEGDLVRAAQAVFPEGADVVVDSTGVPAVLRQSVRIGRTPAWNQTLRDLPRFVVQGSYPGDIAFDYHDVFSREYVVLFPRDRTRFDVEASFDLISRQKIDVRRLVGKPFTPESAPEVYRTLREKPQQMLTAVFAWRKE